MFNPLCFKCNKPSHIKKDCPLLKYKRNFKTFNKFNKKKKDYHATWEDSDSSSSEEEEATETAKSVLWHKNMRYKNILNYWMHLMKYMIIPRMKR